MGFKINRSTTAALSDRFLPYRQPPASKLLHLTRAPGFDCLSHNSARGHGSNFYRVWEQRAFYRSARMTAARADHEARRVNTARDQIETIPRWEDKEDS